MKFVILTILIFSAEVSFAELNYRSSKELTTGNPELFNYSGIREGSLKDYKVVDLSASVDIGSNCGQMDVSANLRANMKEFMSGDFFKGLGNQITNAGGMLALCYLSPAMCSLTKNMRITSSMASDLDLNACSMIEKYQDQQIAVYEKERSQCLRSANQPQCAGH